MYRTFVARFAVAAFSVSMLVTVGLSDDVAALAGCSYSVCAPHDGQVSPAPAPTPQAQVPADVVQAPRPGPVEAPRETLPFTGSDIAQLLAYAVICLATGAVLVRRRSTRS